MVSFSLHHNHWQLWRYVNLKGFAKNYFPITKSPLGAFGTRVRFLLHTFRPFRRLWSITLSFSPNSLKCGRNKSESSSMNKFVFNFRDRFALWKAAPFWPNKLRHQKVAKIAFLLLVHFRGHGSSGRRPADMEWPPGRRDISKLIGQISSSPKDIRVHEVFSWLHTTGKWNQQTVSGGPIAVVPLLRPPKKFLIDWLTDWKKTTRTQPINDLDATYGKKRRKRCGELNIAQKHSRNIMVFRFGCIAS